jgi:hypothetical protein
MGARFLAAIEMGFMLVACSSGDSTADVGAASDVGDSGNAVIDGIGGESPHGEACSKCDASWAKLVLSRKTWRGPIYETVWTIDRAQPMKVAVQEVGVDMKPASQCDKSIVPANWAALEAAVGGQEFCCGIRLGFSCECHVDDLSFQLTVTTEAGQEFSREVACCVRFARTTNLPEQVCGLIAAGDPLW